MIRSSRSGIRWEWMQKKSAHSADALGGPRLRPSRENDRARRHKHEAAPER